MAAKKPAKKSAKEVAAKSGAKGSAKKTASAQLPLASGVSVQPVQLQDEMERSFIDYAMSVIMSRALPDVRDMITDIA